jgi:hypothetical protein
MLCHQLKVNTDLRCGISTSFITVIKPHMKKSVVSTAMGQAVFRGGRIGVDGLEGMDSSELNRY